MNSYEYRTKVTIGDTNLYQNMYFANFFKLQGVVREQWVHDHVTNYLHEFQSGLVLITKEASNSFIKDFYLYDKVLVSMNFVKMSKTFTDLRFRFYEESTMELRSEGRQRIVFADATHKICKIPENFKNAISDFLIEE